MLNQFPVQKVKLTAEKEVSHIFNHYGMYVEMSLGNVSDDTKNEIKDMIFNRLHTKIFHSCFMLCHAKYHPEYKNFAPGEDHFKAESDEEVDAWIIRQWGYRAYGGFEFARDIKEHGGAIALNICGFEDHHLGTEPVERMFANATKEELEIMMGNNTDAVMTDIDKPQMADDYVPVYVDKAVKVVERMINHFDMPVKYISILDEPNVNYISPQQLCRIIRLAREKLDAAGLEFVEINGPAAAGINLAYAEMIKKIDPIAFSYIKNITIHGFGSGNMDKEHRETARQLDRPLWITSTAAPSGIKFCDLPRDENGALYDNWAFAGVVNASAVLIDVNLGASYMGMWVAMRDAMEGGKNRLNVEHQYFMLHTDPHEGHPILGRELVKYTTFDYISTISATFDDDAQIYYCESSEEGDMSERFDLTNLCKNQLAALIGKNKNGKWGICILNKTDSETRKKQKSMLYENIKTHSLVGPSVTLEVELDIPALYGSGERKFAVLATGKNGMYLQLREDIVLTDGKGMVLVQPFEILSIKER